MLTVARAKGPSLIPYLRGDATALPFVDSVFDGIILSMSLHEKTPLARASILAEARRVLKRGGTMLIADFNMPGHGVSRISHPFVHVVERMAGREHYRNFKGFMQQGGMASLLNGCGIQVQQFATFLGNIIAVATVSIQEAE
jgi:ubiquinone/menaquinone biosynthesis C-methylase UbiE